MHDFDPSTPYHCTHAVLFQNEMQTYIGYVDNTVTDTSIYM